MPTPDKTLADAAIARHNSLMEISRAAYVERVSGDFMAPLLKNGDHVLVDPDNDSLADGICCFEFTPGEPMIARVQLIPEGARVDGQPVPAGVRIFGDNRLYEPQHVTTETARLALMGRVRTLMISV